MAVNPIVNPPAQYSPEGAEPDESTCESCGRRVKATEDVYTRPCDANSPFECEACNAEHARTCKPCND